MSDTPLAGSISAEQIKEYAAASGKISSALEQLFKLDGWKIFMALYEKRKKEIKDRADYKTIEEFHADRKAIDIVDGILDDFDSYVKDASEAAEALKKLSTDEPDKDRGIMLIDPVDNASIEG